MEQDEAALFTAIEDGLSRWESGGLTYAWQHAAIADGIAGLLRIKMDRIDELHAIEPRPPTAGDEIKQAAAACERLLALGHRVSAITDDANAKGLKRLGNPRPSFSDGWTVPAPTATGTQAITRICCNPLCGAAHTYEYRVRGGWVEFRTYGDGNAKIPQ
jgi:hypothetical protein